MISDISLVSLDNLDLTLEEQAWFDEHGWIRFHHPNGTVETISRVTIQENKGNSPGG